MLDICIQTLLKHTELTWHHASNYTLLHICVVIKQSTAHHCCNAWDDSSRVQVVVAAIHVGGDSAGVDLEGARVLRLRVAGVVSCEGAVVRLQLNLVAASNLQGGVGPKGCMIYVVACVDRVPAQQILYAILPTHHCW